MIKLFYHKPENETYLKTLRSGGSGPGALGRDNFTGLR